MTAHDWDDAYSNGAYIAGSEAFFSQWAKKAQAAREALLRSGQARLDVPYGSRPLNRLDMFLPLEKPQGLLIFVHGGYWTSTGKHFYSHLCQGGLSHHFAVAIPTYTLCPDASIADITREITQAITAAARQIDGPIMLAGHSAGGHLVMRMACAPALLPETVAGRVRKILSISGLHDLRPLLKTRMNETLRLDLPQARQESPALCEPLANTNVIAWVGALERPEFIRQSQLLTNIWRGFDIEIGLHIEADRHHFNIIDGLADPQHPMMNLLQEIAQNDA